MKILVLGAGAIGGYFGGRLAEAGADVTFLVRPKRRTELERDGIQVRSSIGDVKMPVKTLVASELRSGFQIVLLACKAYDLASALDAVVPAMDARCAVLPLLNGIAHFEALDARFGHAAVVGGTCMINVTLQEDGVIRHQGSLQRLIVGERDGVKSARVQALADTLARTKIDWELSDDIQQNLWEKIAFLSALAAATCLFRANVGEIMSAPGGREGVERVLKTTIEIARSEGHALRETALEFARNILTDPAGTSNASMLRDIERGGPVESDHIIGWMLNKARAYGLDDSMLSLAFTHLKAYEARRAANRLPAA